MPYLMVVLLHIYLILGGQEIWFFNLLYTKFCKTRSLTSKIIYVPGSLCVFVLVLVVCEIQHHFLLPNSCVTHFKSSRAADPHLITKAAYYREAIVS